MDQQYNQPKAVLLGDDCHECQDELSWFERLSSCYEDNERCECDTCKKGNIERVAISVKHLRDTVSEVFECLKVHPSIKFLFPVLTCIVLEEIKEIEKLLEDRTLSFKEIKHGICSIEKEVDYIEDSINNPDFGLKEIK
ncbi:MAG: hypothetical protein H6Q67_2010, partial [Firmicutes bacterium]|nr:hypothetical protein [Bacillota bacterium]